MKEIRRLTITTTRRLRLPAIRGRCPVCGCEVMTLSPSEARVALEVSRERFEELLITGRIHRIPLVSGGWRICRDSLIG